MSEDEADAFRWNEKWIEYRLSDARIYAMLDDGGLITEEGLDLLLAEGRGVGFENFGEDNERTALEYRFEFSIAGQLDYDSWVGKEAVVIITGTHDSGVNLLLKGHGYMGYNEHGSPEGNFEDPPLIEVLLGPSPAELLKKDALRNNEIGQEIREKREKKEKQTRH